MNQGEIQKILLVDDRAESRLAIEGYLKSLLEEHPLEVVVADSGEAALAKTLEHHFALALIDVHMPHMDGFEMAGFMRQVKRTRHIPIIFFSAVRKDRSHVFQGYNAGAVDYMPTPIEPDILRSKVKVFLELDRQQRLIERQEREVRLFRDLLDRSDDEIVVLDVAGGRVVDANAALFRRLGSSRGRFTALDPADQRAALGIEAWDAYVDEVRAAGHLIREGERRGRDGASVAVEANIHYSVDHGVPYIISVVRDVSERKAAAGRLQRERAFLQSVIDGIADPVLVIGRDFRVLQANLSARAASTLPPEEAHYCYRLTHRRDTPCDEADHPCPLCEVLESGRPVTMVHRHPRVDGESRLMEIHASPLRDEDGSISGIIEVSRDITSRAMAEAALRRAKEVAEAADQAKGAFLATLSHEIRTPMNALVGMADLLLETELSPYQKKYVQVFEQAGGALLGLINDTLDLSRLDAGHLQLKHETIDLPHLVHDVVEAVAVTGRGKPLEFRTTVEEGVPRRVEGDPVRLRQLLYNLLGNAVKFSERGEIAVSVLPDDGEGLRFAVSDQGVGIPPERQAAIFERFVQAGVSEGERHGSGLGLAICRNLVHLMGGRIWVESRPGEGSTFSFTLPLTVLPEDGEPPVVAPARGLRLLIVEDAEELRLMLEAFLRASRHTASFACDGAEAVAMAREGGYDLILMDVEMPVLDGFAATREIRAWESGAGRAPVPVLLMTGHTADEVFKQGEAAGCNGYLTKPLRKGELLMALAGWGAGEAVPPAVR